MLIKKTYKFYAAHRNEELQDKCRNVHGHRYEIRCHFRVQRQGSISTLFADFDRRIEPLLRHEYDHAMLVNVHDPLYKALVGFAEQSGDQLRLKRLDGPTSVENLAYQLFSEISEMGFELETLEVQETDTSTLVYSREDWVADRERFGASSGAVATAPVAPGAAAATELVVGPLPASSSVG